MASGTGAIKIAPYKRKKERNEKSAVGTTKKKETKQVHWAPPPDTKKDAWQCILLELRI